jgi:hypothetical protein
MCQLDVKELRRSGQCGIGRRSNSPVYWPRPLEIVSWGSQDLPAPGWTSETGLTQGHEGHDEPQGRSKLWL